AATDLTGCQPQGPRAPLDLVSQKLEADAYVNDARLVRVQRHAQRLQESGGLSQRTVRFRPCVAGDHPIVGIPRQPIASATHRSVKRSQKAVAEHRRDYSPLGYSLLRREKLAFGEPPRLEHPPDQAEHPTICNALGNECHELFLIRRSEKV